MRLFVTCSLVVLLKSCVAFHSLKRRSPTTTTAPPPAPPPPPSPPPSPLCSHGGGELSKAEQAWERKTLGELDKYDAPKQERLLKEKRAAWAHIRAARRALAEGFVAKARASYGYYLQRFSSSSAVFLADVCLRLAILEHNVGNATGAKRVFRKGAKIVHGGLLSTEVDDTDRLRERGATLYCSWGLHEYKSAASPQVGFRRSRSFLRHAVTIDKSKSPILNWQKFRQAPPATRLYAATFPLEEDAAALPMKEEVAEEKKKAPLPAAENDDLLPLWKAKQNERYDAMSRDLLTAAAEEDVVKVQVAATDLEARSGMKAPARSPRLLGTWRLAYAAKSGCNCACAKAPQEDTTALPAGTSVSLFGPGMATSVAEPIPIGSFCRCELDGAIAAFSPTADDVLDFNAAGQPLEGPTKVTYLDDNVMILRRPRCGNPLVVLEKQQKRHDDDDAQRG